MVFPCRNVCELVVVALGFTRLGGAGDDLGIILEKLVLSAEVATT
jgi:hypothetical protein